MKTCIKVYGKQILNIWNPVNWPAVYVEQAKRLPLRKHFIPLNERVWDKGQLHFRPLGRFKHV